MLVERELLGILQRHKPLIGRDLEQQSLRQRGLPRARRARHQDVLLGPHGGAQERLHLPACVEIPKYLLGRRGPLRRLAARKESARIEHVEAQHAVGRLSDRECHGSRCRRRWQHDLHALSRRERGRQERVLRGHPLLGRSGDQPRDLAAPLERGKGERNPRPAARPLDERLVRSVDAQFRELGIVKERPKAREVLRQSAR